MIKLKVCKNCNKITDFITTSVIEGGQSFIRETCPKCGNKVNKTANYIHYGEDRINK